jgi:hypothetical protein
LKKTLETTRAAASEAERATVAAAKAADAAYKMSLLAEDTSRRELRAYVGVESLEFRAPDISATEYEAPPADAPGIVSRNRLAITVKNFGQTPAYDVMVFAYFATSEFGTTLPPEFYEANDSDSTPGDGVRVTYSRTLISRDQSHQAVISLWDITELRRAHEGTAAATIYGRIYYRDAFDRTWRTRFAYVWQPWEEDTDEEFVPAEHYNGEDQKTLS